MKNGKRIHSIEIERLADNDPDTSYLEQSEFEDRLDQYKRDVFSFIGIRAKAEIRVYIGPSHGLIQTITSGGLWGIESDSDDHYIHNVEQEELDSLKQQLHALGFSKRAISAAFREVSNVR